MNMNTEIFYVGNNFTKTLFWIERTRYSSWIKSMMKLIPPPCHVDAFTLENGDSFDVISKFDACSIKNSTLPQFAILSDFYEKEHIVHSIGYSYFHSFEDTLKNIPCGFSCSVFVYDRVFNPLTRSFSKINVSIDPENVSYNTLCILGKNERDKKIEKIREDLDRFENKKRKISCLHHASLQLLQLQTDDLYGDDKASVKEACAKWQDMGFLQPAPKQIKKIKLDLNMSWVELIKSIKSQKGEIV